MNAAQLPLLWFCDSIYHGLHQALGVSRRILVLVCIVGMVTAAALHVTSSEGGKQILWGWFYGLFILAWLASLTFNEFGPSTLVTTTGSKRSEPPDFVACAFWLLVAVVWIIGFYGAVIHSAAEDIIPPAFWWYVTARGFQSIDDDDGEPLVRRLWNKASSTIDSLTPSPVGAP